MVVILKVTHSMHEQSVPILPESDVVVGHVNAAVACSMVIRPQGRRVLIQATFVELEASIKLPHIRLHIPVTEKQLSKSVWRISLQIRTRSNNEISTKFRQGTYANET